MLDELSRFHGHFNANGFLKLYQLLVNHAQLMTTTMPTTININK